MGRCQYNHYYVFMDSEPITKCQKNGVHDRYKRSKGMFTKLKKKSLSSLLILLYVSENLFVPEQILLKGKSQEFCYSVQKELFCFHLN